MTARLPDGRRWLRLACTVALAVAAVVAVSALAPDTSAAAELAQVTDGDTGEQTRVPGLGSGGDGEEPGAAGELPFTGLMLLPLVMLAVLLVFGGIALRRRSEQRRTLHPRGR